MASAEKSPQQFVDYSRVSGVKPHDWRWQQATYLNSLRRMRAPTQDIWVQRLLLYLRGQLVDRLDTEALSQRYPELNRAQYLATSQRTAQQWFLNALLLTPLSFRQISLLLPIPENDIRVYEQVFFDIRAYLQYPFYVHSALFSDLFTGSPSLHRSGKLLAYAAYQGGIEALYELCGERPNHGQNGAVFLDKSVRIRRMIKQWVATHALETNGFNQLSIVLSQAEYDKAVSETSSGGTGLRDVEQQAVKMLEAINPIISPLLSNESLHRATDTGVIIDDGRADVRSRLLGGQRKSVHESSPVDAEN